MRCYVLERGNTISATAVEQAIPPSLGSHASSQKLGNLDDAVAKLGKQMIEQALETTAGKKAEAARLLGFSNYQTMNNRYSSYQQRSASRQMPRLNYRDLSKQREL